jgi:hypothetical protein
MTTLMPMPAQMANAMPGAANAKGLKFTISLDQVNRMNPGQRGQGQPEKVNIKALGTTEKIAGYACDDYEITNARGEAWRMCASSTLGTFVFPGMSGPMGRGSSGAPDWARALGNKPMFPLKVWTPGDNKVSFEVTAIERIAVPDSTFVVPDGYMDMSAFGRGRGGD